MGKDSFKSNNPRYVAVRILEEITFNDKIFDDFLFQGDFVKLSPQDRDFCHFLVMGTLKRILLIDFLIKKVSNFSFKKINPFILSLLRISVFQIFFSERIPAYAILNEAVEIAKGKFKGKKYIISYVNGILRKIVEIEDIFSFLDKNCEDENIKFSIRLNIPQFLLEKLLKSYDKVEIERFFLKAFNPPKYYGVINKPKVKRSNLTEILKRKRINYIEIEDGLFAFKDVKAIKPLIEEGFLFLQDISIYNFFKNLELKFKKVLDLCAAPGGKSFQISMRFSPDAIFAVDKSFERLFAMKKRRDMLGFKNINLISGDCGNLGFLKEKFDLVFLDVPCTSTGTYRKNPEVFLRVDESKIDEMKKIQLKFLEEASSWVKRGGCLIYSTCSLLRDENDDMVEEFLKKGFGYKLVDKYNSFPKVIDGIGFFATVLRKD